MTHEQKHVVQLSSCFPRCTERAALRWPQVFAHMQARGVDADVVTCCSLISALERGGQWHLAQQLFLDMCRAAAAAGSPQVSCIGNCVHISHAGLWLLQLAAYSSPCPQCHSSTALGMTSVVLCLYLEAILCDSHTKY